MTKYDYDIGTYQIGETVRVEAHVTNAAGASVDPTTTKMTLKSPSRAVVVNDVAMTPDTTGEFYSDYNIPSDTGEPGEYSGKVELVGATSRVTIKTFKFTAVRDV